MGQQEQKQKSRSTKEKPSLSPPSRKKKNRFKQIGNIIVLGTRALCRKVLRGVSVLACYRSRKISSKSEKEEETLHMPKEVMFSDMCFIHTYPLKQKKGRFLSLKKISNSFPPKSMKGIEKLKGSSKETPLARKVISAIEKNQSRLDTLREILSSRKKPSEKEKEMGVFRPSSSSSSHRKSKSHILNILDSYSEPSVSDAYQAREDTSEEEAYERKKKSKRSTPDTSSKSSKKRSCSKHSSSSSLSRSESSHAASASKKKRAYQTIDSDELSSAAFDINKSQKRLGL
ncbi:hypothetical protein NECID01_0190 [Nematocida sp. AWRm77]|nr:hypothetical protein NECID01_0190 [Nematocida sp. AWRm77]